MPCPYEDEPPTMSQRDRSYLEVGSKPAPLKGARGTRRTSFWPKSHSYLGYRDPSIEQLQASRLLE
jgi:hypothetical protein